MIDLNDRHREVLDFFSSLLMLYEEKTNALPPFLQMMYSLLAGGPFLRLS